ncbi:MAG TPA: ATP-binding protein [Candidatus Solibacter sp.]|nr:ATP-binding protein [Candidatus Solibacter sp.]
MNSRLLVIDGDPVVHEQVAGVLQHEGMTIQDAFTQREALERLRTVKFDLVVAGQGNNGFDGLNLMRRMRSLQPRARVIVTGDADRSRIVRAVREHAYAYFHRPIQGAQLWDMVQQALDSRAWKDDIRVISARPEWITLDVRCKFDAAERTTHFLREMVADLPVQTREDVGAAIRELLMNAVEHGGHSNPRKRARASLLRTARAVIVHIHDPGTGFSLDFLPHAAISNPADSPIKHVEVRAGEGKRPGGFGILMTRNMVDELLYNERGNAVLFVKYL